MKKKPILMEDDPLGFVFEYHQFMNHNKMSTFLVFCSILVAFSFASVVCFFLWKEHGTEFFLKRYSAIFCAGPWIFTVMVMEALVIRTQLKLIHREKFWDIKTASIPMRTKLQRSIRIKRIESASYMLQCLVTGFVCPLIGQIFGNSVYPDLHYVANYYSGSISSKVLIYTCIYTFHQIATFYAISSYMLLKYLVQSVGIQLNILADFLQRANEFKDDHSSINKHLKTCAVHHVLLLETFKVVQQVVYSTFLFLLFCGQLLLLSCSIFLYYNRNPLDVLQIGSILFLSYVLAMDCCQGGQDVNDAFYEFRFSLNACRWYNWNEANKKTLLIILCRTQKEEMIKTLGLCVDRTLMVRILKYAYQAMLIFLKITQD